MFAPFFSSSFFFPFLLSLAPPLRQLIVWTPPFEYSVRLGLSSFLYFVLCCVPAPSYIRLLACASYKPRCIRILVLAADLFEINICFFEALMVLVLRRGNH
jgi:hypothetical protein